MLVTSDTRTKETDETGKNAIRLLEEEGHEVHAYEIVSNDEEAIQEAVGRFLNDEKIEVIITSGGTGISSRDKTIEVVTGLLEKQVEGFGELFRRLSYEEIGEAAILSRAVAGTVGRKLIFSLPGSKGAVELGLRRIILPVLGHMLWEVSR
ncbi:MAG: molybdenum cofactor biosynthesis protein B [Candidatus Bathyarchaeia archaeon]